MAFPKIVWPSAGGNTVVFTWQPMRFTSVQKFVVRHDSISTAGVQETITERVDNLLTLEMEFVAEADLAGWGSFFDSALQGNAFDFFPDAALGASTTYILTDAEFSPKWTHNDSAGAVYRFTLHARKKI